MSNHVIEWLNAYLDGELKGKKLHQVEEHLAECEACQAELESLQGMSSLLHEVPAGEFTANETFVLQVNLLLPQRPVASTRRKILEVGWWMVPIGLLTVWVFISTTILVSDMLSVANNFGLLDNVGVMASDTSSNAYWTSTLGQFGLLQGSNLQWAERTESISRNLIPQIVWQISVALLYLTWIAIWWARQRLQGNGQALES